MFRLNRGKGLPNLAVVFLLVLLLDGTVGFAQLPTATILGVVKDRSGAVMPQAVAGEDYFRSIGEIKV